MEPRIKGILNGREIVFTVVLGDRVWKFTDYNEARRYLLALRRESPTSINVAKTVKELSNLDKDVIFLTGFLLSLGYPCTIHNTIAFDLHISVALEFDIEDKNYWIMFYSNRRKCRVFFQRNGMWWYETTLRESRAKNVAELINTMQSYIFDNMSNNSVKFREIQYLSSNPGASNEQR